MSFKYRKKPVVIEAYQIIDPKDEQTRPIPNWLIEATIKGVVRPYTDGTLVIDTLEGPMRAQIGDWIIQGIQGELYPCKPEIFAATYEKAE